MSMDLEALRQKNETRKELQAKQAQLQSNIATLEQLLPSLQQSAQEEQEDVDRMESGGFTSFVYGLMGKQEEKMAKERREAAEAQQKYMDALRTLQELHKQREDLQSAIAALGDAEAAYQRAFAEKRRLLLSSDSPDSVHLRRLEEDGRQLHALEQELLEAQNAGQQVLDKISAIQRKLKNASAFGALDMFSDSFLADVAKYSSMDDAQREMEELSRLLGRFSKELRDLDVNFQLSADIGSGMRFADFFFDNIFTDYMAYQRIDNLKRQVQDTENRVRQYMDLVDRKQCSVAKTLAEKKLEAEALILQAK